MAMLKAHGWPVAAAILVGFALLPIAQREYEAWADARQAAQQQARPVVSMHGTLVQRDDVSVWVHIAGTKLRACGYLGLTAYSIDGQGVRRDANIERADGVQVRGASKDPGAYDLGVWRIWPVQDSAVRALVSVEHDCMGVIVRSVIAEVVL